MPLIIHSGFRPRILINGLPCAGCSGLAPSPNNFASSVHCALGTAIEFWASSHNADSVQGGCDKDPENKTPARTGFGSNACGSTVRPCQFNDSLVSKGNRRNRLLIAGCLAALSSISTDTAIIKKRPSSRWMKWIDPAGGLSPMKGSPGIRN
jgi:hypothetical protein